MTSSPSPRPAASALTARRTITYSPSGPSSIGTTTLPSSRHGDDTCAAKPSQPRLCKLRTRKAANMRSGRAMLRF